MRGYITILLLVILSLNIALANSDKSYRIDFIYSDNILEFFELMVVDRPPSLLNLQGYYRAETISFSGEALWSGNFDIPRLDTHEDIFDENGRLVEQIPIEQEANNMKFLQYFPYFPNAKSINIYDPKGNLALEIDVGYFADVCGDRNCQPHESYFDCPEDCKSGGKDDYCDKVKDNICDPDCLKTQDTDCKEEIFSKNQMLLFLGIALVLIIIFILIVYFYKRSTE